MKLNKTTRVSIRPSNAAARLLARARRQTGKTTTWIIEECIRLQLTSKQAAPSASVGSIP